LPVLHVPHSLDLGKERVDVVEADRPVLEVQLRRHVEQRLAKGVGFRVSFVIHFINVLFITLTC